MRPSVRGVWQWRRQLPDRAVLKPVKWRATAWSLRRSRNVTRWVRRSGLAVPTDYVDHEVLPDHYLVICPPDIHQNTNPIGHTATRATAAYLRSWSSPGGSASAAGTPAPSGDEDALLAACQAGLYTCRAVNSEM
jgi:hypothetical protein